MIIGPIQWVKSQGAKNRLNFKEVHSGWKISVRGSKTVQQLIICTTDKPATRKALEGVFGE